MIYHRACQFLLGDSPKLPPSTTSQADSAGVGFQVPLIRVGTTHRQAAVAARVLSRQ
jgi:hypothetical protein